MALYNIDRLIKEYHNTIKDKYPHINLDRLDKICRGMFYFIKSNLVLDSLPIVRIKYWGIFIVKSRTLKGKLRDNKDDLDKGVITKEKYEEKKQVYLNILKIAEQHENKQKIIIVD